MKAWRRSVLMVMAALAITTVAAAMWLVFWRDDAREVTGAPASSQLVQNDATGSR